MLPERAAEHGGVLKRKIGALPVVWMNSRRSVTDQCDAGPDPRRSTMGATGEEPQIIERAQVRDDPLGIGNAAQIRCAPRVEVAALHRVAVLVGDVVEEVRTLAQGQDPVAPPSPAIEHAGIIGRRAPRQTDEIAVGTRAPANPWFELVADR